MIDQQVSGAAAAGNKSAPLPYSIEMISDVIADYVPPEGPFDPHSDWTQHYEKWGGRGGNAFRAGSLEIVRKASRDQMDLAISQTTFANLEEQNQERLVANARCATDKLATLVNWSLRWESFGGSGEALPYTRTEAAGEAQPGVLRLTRNNTKTYRVGKALTGSWVIMEAVQRLPFERCTLRFDFLDDLEAPKADHRLDYGGTYEMSFSGRRVKLHHFEHLGQGILPISYWLDEDHRLLFVVGGARSFVLSSGEASR